VRQLNLEKIRQRRWLISAQGWSAATTLGMPSEILQILKGLIPHMLNAFSVYSDFCICAPRVVAALQPWAEISQRLRRILFFKFQTDALPKIWPGKKECLM
jgi:hypothetical protein